jgi:hypothetical protein
MAFGTSFGQSLTLPLQKTLDGAMSSVVGFLQNPTQQLTSSLSVASNAQKQAETLLRMQGGREYDQFNSVTRQMNLDVINGMKIATDAGTGTPITAVGPVQDSSTPASVGNDASGNTGDDRTPEYKVVLSSEPKISGWLQDITLNVMPTISESRQVQYESFSPLHHPGEIMKYKSTSSRTWSIAAKLVSRNISEASMNLAIINTIRGWMMPFYGEGTASDDVTQSYLGAPPAIVTLKAYGSTMIGPVKCVIESANWTWPNDVDYVQAKTFDDEQVPFPVVMQIDISLKESWSPAEYSGFSLSEYRRGNLPKAFATVSAGSAPRGAQSGQRPTPNAGYDPAAVNTSEATSAAGATARAGEPAIYIPRAGK